MKYSWQALLLYNKPFDHFKILVWLHFIFWASKPPNMYPKKILKIIKKKKNLTDPVFF